MRKIIALLFPSMASSFVGFSSTARTVDGALVHFNKALAELRVVKAERDAEEQRQLDIAATATSAANEAQREAVRAAKAIVKIEDFVL